MSILPAECGQSFRLLHIYSKKGDKIAISEANSLLFNDPFGLIGHFFRYNSCRWLLNLINVSMYILRRRKVALCYFTT